MADPTTAKFGKFRVLLGNAASPEVFTAPCGFNSKALNLTKNLSEITLPDCDDPDAAAWIARDVESLSAAISGEGVLAKESADEWMDAFESADSVNVKVEIDFTTYTYVYTGAMHLSTFNMGAERGGRVTASIEMQSDGELARAIASS